MTTRLSETVAEGDNVGSEPPSSSNATGPPPASGILKLFWRLNYFAGGRGKGRAGSLANQHSGNREGEELPETTWLVTLRLSVLVLCSDLREGPNVQGRGKQCSYMCREE